MVVFKVNAQQDSRSNGVLMFEALGEGKVSTTQQIYKEQLIQVQAHRLILDTGCERGQTWIV